MTLKEFYGNLGSAINCAKIMTFEIVMDDLDAKVGSSNTTAGPFGLAIVTRGNIWNDWCKENSMTAVNKHLV